MLMLLGCSKTEMETVLVLALPEMWAEGWSW